MTTEHNNAAANNVTARVGEIDLLRFIAAMLVVFFHYTFRGYARDNYSPVAFPLLGQITKYGYLGVELFFMISGFVILMTASNGSLQKFISSRVARLYPAYWVCCGITFVVILLFGGERFSAGISQFLINLTMLNEFVNVRSVDGVYWSLAVELKFYFLVAVVLLLRQIHRAQWFLVGWLVVTIALELYPNLRLRSIFLTDYAPFFIAGATCFLIYQQGWSLARCAIILVTFVTSVRASLAWLPGFDKTYQVEYNAVVVALLLAIFFAVMLLIASKKTGVISRRNWVAVGALTYPLYLLHQNVGYIMLTASHGRVDPYIALVVIVAFMLIAAWMVHRFVERPFSKPLRMFTEKLLTAVGFNRILPNKP